MKQSDDSRTGAMKDMLFQSLRKLREGVTSSIPSLRNGDDLSEGREDWSTIEFDSDDDDFSNISTFDGCAEKERQNVPISGPATISLQHEENNQEHPQKEQTSQTRSSSGSSVERENNEIFEETQVRVENLPLNVNSLELATLFQKAGFVKKLEIMFDDPLSGGCGISQGNAFVTMGTTEEADKVVLLFNGSYLGKNAITVTRIKCHPCEKTNSINVGKLSNKRLGYHDTNSNGLSVEGEHEICKETKVRVGNLPSTMNSHDLTKLFHRAGVVIKCEIMDADRCRTSQGFGFVTMSTTEEADKAVHLFNGSYFDGTPITVNRTKLRQHEKTYNIQVDNLSNKMNDKHLEELFRGNGYNVMRASSLAHLEHWAWGKCGTNSGFVEMASYWEREYAVITLDGKMVHGRRIKLTATKRVFKDCLTKCLQGHMKKL